MTGPVAARMVLRDPSVELAVLETARGGLLRAGLGYRRANVGAVLNVQADHLGLRGVDTLEDLAQVKRIVIEVAQRHRGAQRRRPAVPEDGRLHQGRPHLLRHHEPPPRAGARAHPRGRPGGGAGGGDQRPHDHPLRPRHPHPAAVDPPDPGDARGPGAAQRPERDVRRRHRLQPGRGAGGHPPRPAHLRHHLLPGAGPAQRLRRAPLQGDPRLRPQRGGGQGDGRPGRAPAAERAGGSSSSPPPATAATRTSAPSPRACAGHFDRYVCRRDDNPRGRADDEVPAPPARDAARRRGAAPESIEVIPDEQAAVDSALRAAGPGDLLARLRRPDQPHLEADHPLLPGRERRPAGRRPGAGAGPRRAAAAARAAPPATPTSGSATSAACGWPARRTD